MPIDKRQQLIDEISSKIKTGEPLNEDGVLRTLNLARSYSLLYLVRETISGKPAGKKRIKEFNSLQNACERHELMNRGGNGDALAALASEWQAAIERTKS